MHSPLERYEQYLTDVATHLKVLPAASRNEELREVRQHLRDAVLVNREFGQSEEEAIRSALEQMGPPQELGASLVYAWRRGNALSRRSFWGSAVCTLTLAAALPPLFNTTFVVIAVGSLVTNFAPRYEWHLLTYLVHMLAGVISGLAIPKRSVAGSALGATVWYSFLAILILAQVQWVADVPGYLFAYAAFVSVTILGAWIGSRLRKPPAASARA